MCACDFGKGLRVEHCGACCETFSGTTAGDLHRVGRHDTSAGPERRRCLTVSEMLARGMVQNSRGIWMSSARESETPYRPI